MAAELPPASGILTDSRLEATTGGWVTSLNSLKTVRTDSRREMVRRSDDNSRGNVQNVPGGSLAFCQGERGVVRTSSMPMVFADSAHASKA